MGALLRELFSDLQTMGVDMVICTKGLVGPVQKCLEDLDLRDYFSMVFGNVYGETQYDKIAAVDPPDLSTVGRLLGSAESAGWLSKDQLVATLMSRAGLQHKSEACLIEDDPEEIRRATGVSRTLLVAPARGIQAEHLVALREMVSCTTPPEGVAAAKASGMPQTETAAPTCE